MANENPAVVNIALIGGGENCREVLEMTTVDFLQDQVNSRIVAVAESDDTAPGWALARKKNLTIVADYRQLYDPAFDVHLFILLDPDPHLLHQILKTKLSG